MNKKLLSITSGSGIVAITFAVIFTAGLLSPTEEKIITADDLIKSPPVKILDIIAGKSVVDVNRASMNVGYDVKFPEYLPDGYTVKRINADSDINVVTMLASTSAVTEETILDDFFDNKGILIFMEKNQPGFDSELWLHNWARDNKAEIIEIGNTQGAVHAPIEIPGTNANKAEIIPGEIVFVRNGVLYEVRGIATVSELSQIASGI